jgi:hypothetical protein
MRDSVGYVEKLVVAVMERERNWTLRMLQLQRADVCLMHAADRPFNDMIEEIWTLCDT